MTLSSKLEARLNYIFYVWSAGPAVLHCVFLNVLLTNALSLFRSFCQVLNKNARH